MMNLKTRLFPQGYLNQFWKMFGSKLRSWMEAVRSRKKQHRKEKQAKCNNLLFGHKNTVKWDTNNTLHGDYRNNDAREPVAIHSVRPENQCQSGSSGVSNSRYSANNLSSPESAYSTGYSTDGTSPGAPPENLLNSSRGICRVDVLNAVQSKNSCKVESVVSSSLQPNSTPILKEHITPILKKREHEEPKYVSTSTRITDTIAGSLSPALGVTSPRQRNRIRTNPWLPSGASSPSPVKHGMNKTALGTRPAKESPRLRRFLSPVVSRRRSLSSSSCSSLSATSIQLEVPRPRSVSDEDCTLNEMMGKFDESYVYEKETDILSDSDPTDCETDIDTGQDGGDEDDPYEGELDFIDNCSYLEFEGRTDNNTGHCSYHNFDVQRKRSSRRRTQRRNNKCSEKKRRSCSNKKRQSKQADREKQNNPFIDGSKSAGATPVSVRRATSRPVSKLALENCLRKRSNSVSSHQDSITTIDRRDKEADLKYRELITEAEQILRAMKTNGLSPRRVPGPANKRVELLRFTECAKPETFVKNRAPLIEDTVMTNPFCSKIPSTSGYNCPRFSPKKNHITKFIISNSPVLARKEWEMQPMIYKSPTCAKKQTEEAYPVQKSILHKERTTEGSRVSPKHRRKFSRPNVYSSSDSDEASRRNGLRASGCPRSEPVRRKTYSGSNVHRSGEKGRTVAFNVVNGTTDNFSNRELTSSTENIRQQVLLNTIVNLKKNLEDHSASLKQVYRSSHNIYV
ncbi:hypothetical protein JTB14_035234 [Gonioctena quinquepunctata]|nr:hypothetical protein JTB14_035234 [Gonioctena quinquepunctata]